jgi:hypothetical protein
MIRPSKFGRDSTGKNGDLVEYYEDINVMKI